MADPRTFTLIGEFKDGITPELEKINKQLATLKASFAGIGSRKNTGFRGSTQDIGKLVSAHKNLSASIKNVQNDLRSTLSVLKDYRREMGKAAAATRAFQKSGGALGSKQFVQNMDAANRSAQAYLRTLQQINTQSRRTPRGVMGAGAGGAGGGGYTRPPRTPRGGGGGGVEGGDNFPMAQFTLAFGLSQAISKPIEAAVVSGFQIGVGLMTKPFEYFANNFGERVRDELSDLKAAGGFFSISQRQEGEKFIKTFDQAVDFTQENNKILAKLAAALPGSTQDYIEVSKRISDTVARTVVKDQGAAIKYAEQLRQQDVSTYGQQAITGAGPGAQQRAIQVMLGELTKKTVLAGQGGRAGAGGAMGAYGLPQLTERILSQQEVSMGQFQRYSAIFSDPMIMDALAREIPKINETAANSVERFKAVQKLYDSVLPPELIERYKRTVAGVAETFRTAILGPETGLFGLGRKMDGLGEKFDEFGKVVKDADGKTVKASLSLFDFVRDFIANIGQVFQPIIENITLFYDPLRQLGTLLADARRYTFKLLESFNYYVQGFKDLGFKDGNLRASLATIANLLRYVGAIGSGDFANIVDQLKQKKVDFGAILKGLIDKLLNSKVAEEVGKVVGKVIGTVISEVAKVTGFLSGRIASSNKLFDGLKEGFNAAGGPAAFKNVFKDIFASIGKVLLSIASIIPIEAYVIGALMLVLPVAIQTMAMALSHKIADALFGSVKKLAVEESVQGAGRGARARRYDGGPFGETRSMRAARLKAQRRAQRFSQPYVQGAQTMGAFAKGAVGASPVGNIVQGLGKRGKGLGRFVPGGAMAAGAIDLATSLASGENFGKAAVGAFGTVLGGAAGSIFGPVGTVIGSIAGGMLADAASDFVIGAFDQNKAALMQIEAAQKQVAAASESAITKYGPEFGEKLGGVEALSQALGGGAGVEAYAQEQLRLGKILPEQAQQWSILGKDLSTVNVTTKKVQDAQKKYEIAVKANTGEQTKYKTMLENAKKAQEAALARVTSNWETMSSTSRVKLLSGADNIVAALDGAAAKIRGWKGIPGFTPAPPKGPATPPTSSKTQAELRKGPQALDSKRLIPGTPATPESGYGAAKGSPGVKFGNLGSALSYEMKNKPLGSDLMIANSSETVIPAAGGHGMEDFMRTLQYGFNTIVSTYRDVQNKQTEALRAINSTLQTNQQQTNVRLATLEKKFTSPSMPGGLGGGAAGGVDAFTPIAQRFGLSMTSSYRPGDPGYHGANRARDFSNGTGPTPQMMQFAQYMASTYGANLKELIYTPLGYSIKNGQRVAPYAQSGHYNHVHVAYAFGKNNPVAFGSQYAAENWERAMTPGSVKVSSVTGNSAEGFGGNTTINGGINVTVNGSGVTDTDALASIIALKIGDAVAQARAASIYV